ncbi:MAG TPA: hypothetical protein VHX37_13340 [Acidobacteriaceae bacterium]|jgi:hypothetical protein|nr:hypothetical protein [Acidobacteriaceae bacterium]
MTCEVLVGRRWMRRCDSSAVSYEVIWRGQSLGRYSLCPHHASLVANKPVDLVRLSNEGAVKYPRNRRAA